MRILLAGCGGTGTEILKLLYNGDDELLLVDYDKIALSNLHRSSMFTREDLGAYKSQRAAEIMSSRRGSRASFLVQRMEDVSINILDRYDVVIGALDNVEGRMNLNLMFRQSECKLYIDCGINGYKAHAKAVYNASSCLYCIKDLYMEEGEPNTCSLRSIPERVVFENRYNVLRSMVELEREKKSNRKSKIRRIVNDFNALVEDEKLRTSPFEVMGMYDGIVPNVCFVNSICASMVYELLNATDTSFDYIFYNGEERISFTKLLLGKDKQCLVCGTDSAR